jgi:hypothetical protein
MRKTLEVLIRAYAAFAAYAVALTALIALVLFATGSIDGARVRAAVEALRRGPPPAPAAAAPASASAQDPRRAELRRLEEHAADTLAKIRGERELLDAQRREAAATIAEAKKTREEMARVRNDAEIEANLPMLSKLDAAGIIAILRESDDARFVRYLRALRPSKAAEVLEALRTDPQFEADFRRVAVGAPAGAKPRVEQLNEELKKAP